MELADQVTRLQAQITQAAREAGRNPAEVTLCAATKVQSAQTVRAAIAAGITLCGENRVQEMTQKLEENAYDGAMLHFIGHLQTNKVKDVVGRVDMIESVDSVRLLEAINHRAGQLELVQDVLLEVNIAGEDSKGGIFPAQLPSLAELAVALPHIHLRGLMCIPPPVVDEKKSNRNFFAETRHLFVDIRTQIGDNETDMDCLSMGMSGDFMDAVREGATLVRVGTALFGPRPPMKSIGTL